MKVINNKEGVCPVGSHARPVSQDESNIEAKPVINRGGD